MFQEIFSRDAPAIFRYLRRLTGSRQTAEDLLQEAFLKLHLQLTSAAPLDNPRAWLFRVATNLARDRARAELHAGAREQEYAAALRPVDFRQHLEQRQSVTGALGRMPPRMRQVLLLQAEGFTYREIAEIASIESGYVGVLLQRARAEFRRVYEEQNEQRQQHPAWRRVR